MSTIRLIINIQKTTLLIFGYLHFDAKYGWYRYDTRFALPVYNEDQELERFNVFQAVLLIRHAQDGKLYLYDLVNIKKETGKPLEQ